jgi:hypothetical protein
MIAFRLVEHGMERRGSVVEPGTGSQSGFHGTGLLKREGRNAHSRFFYYIR